MLVVECGLIAYLFIKKQEKSSSINNCGVHPVIYNEDYVCNVLHGNLVKDVMLRNFEKFLSGKAFPGS